MATEPLDTLQLKIESDASAAARGLKELQGALKTLRTSLSRSKALDLGPVADEISKFASAVNSVNTDKIERLADAISSIRSSSKGLSASMRSATRAVTAVQESTGGRSARPTAPRQGGAAPEDEGTQSTGDSEVKRQVYNYGKVLATAKRVFSTIVSSAKTSFRVITDLVLGIGKAFLRVGEIAKTAFLAPIKYIGNGLSKIYKNATGLIRSVARIALYRAIRTAIKMVTQGLSEGIQNLYQWSLLVDRTFANSMDSIATSMQYLHNGFASMFSPLINYAAPIIEEVTNRLVDFFNVVQQIFATLTGASTWTKAVRVQKQYAEAVTDTGKAAEKAMHQVMAFDELNIINSPNDSGSPGSGTNTPDYGSMFVTEEVDTGLKSWVEEIKKFFESGEFRGLGTYVGDKLNALVNQWTAYSDGFMFGKKIRNALEALNGFLESFNFYDLGKKVGNWLSGFLDGVNPEEIQRAIVNIINKAVSGASGLIDSLVSHNVPIKIGQAIGTSFAMVDWGGLTNLIRKIMLSIVDMVNAAASSFIANGGPQKLVDACKTIGSAIGEAFATVNWADVVTVVTSIFTGLVTMFSSAISSFVELGGPAKLRDALGQIGIAIGQAFASIRGKDLAAIINAIAGGVLDMFKSAFTAFSKGGGWKELGEFIKGLDWATLLTIGAVPITIKVTGLILKGITYELIGKKLVSAMLGKAAASGMAGQAASAAADATSGVGTFFTIAKTATGLGLTVFMATTLVMTLAGVEMPWVDWVRDFFNQPESEHPLLEGVKKWCAEVDEWLGNWNPFKAFYEWLSGDELERGEDGKYRPKQRTGGPATEFAPAFPSKSIGGGSSGGNKMAWFYVNIPKDLDAIQKLLLDINDNVDTRAAVTESAKSLAQNVAGSAVMSIDAKLTSGGTFRDALMKPVTEEFNRVRAYIDSSDIPAKAGTMATAVGTRLKSGLTETNVPAKFRETALASLDEFGKRDFSEGGRHAGNSIKSGFDASNVAGVVSTAAQNAMAAFRNANWASAGAQGGATLGKTFKDHFVANAKSTLMLQTAAGKPITQAYVVPYAQGGYVQGGLFLAGEVAGQSEMVGSINGRTGVASGEEITGIREAVVSTGDEEASLLRQLLTVGQALLMKDPFGTPNSAAGRWIAQSQQAYKAVTG